MFSMLGHVYMSMQLIASEVSADYYTYPRGIVKIHDLSVNAYNYISTCNGLTHKVGSKTIQLVQDPNHINQCCGCDENGKYCV